MRFLRWTFNPLLWVGFVYCLLVLFYLSPVPNGDDFDLLLDRADALKLAISPGDYLKLFFSRHNEHPCFIAVLSSLLSMLLLGRLSVFFILVLGNLTLFAYLLQLAWLPARTYSAQTKVRVLLALALGLLVFTPVFAELNVFASASIGLSPMLCFAALAFGIASSTGKSAPALAFATAVLSALSFAGGALSLAVLSGFYVIKRRFFWAVSGLLLFLIFLFFALGSNQGGGYALNILPDYFICLLGSAFGFNTKSGSRFAGMLILGALFLIPRKKLLFKEQSRDSLLLLYLLLLCLAISWGRHFSSEFESSFLTSRYKLISLSLLVLLLKFYYSRQECISRGKALGFLALACAYSLFSFKTYLPELRSRQPLLADQALAMNLGLAPAKVLHPSPSRVSQLLVEARQSGTYELPPPDLHSALSTPIATPGNCENKHFRLQIEQKLLTADYLLLSGWAFDTEETSDVILTLNSPAGEQSFLAKRRERLDVYLPFRKKRYSHLAQNSGFFLLVQNQNLRGEPESVLTLRLITAQGKCLSRELAFK